MIYETYSKRQKQLAQAGTVDVYQYEDFPPQFRVQVIHIWTRAIGSYDRSRGANESCNDDWKFIHDRLAEEAGAFSLPRTSVSYEDDQMLCQSFLMRADGSGVRDIVELSFRVIDRVSRHRGHTQFNSIIQDADDAIADLNARFREHGIGYEYASGELVRVGSQYIHDQAVKPALALLNTPGFEGVQEEFLAAHGHYLGGK